MNETLSHRSSGSPDLQGDLLKPDSSLQPAGMPGAKLSALHLYYKHLYYT